MSATPTIPPLRVERHRLANGLEVVIHPDPRLPLVAVNLWYHAGSKNERPGKTGFAHLFEHMLFQGSANVGDNDHFRYVQQVGGVANGSTWYDRTNYFETLPADSLDLGLWLESDRMGFLLPAMTSEKLENQRGVVMNERLQRVDNQPYGRASERLQELAFPDGHPYHWPVIGYMEDIAAATLDDVREFFQTYYAPNNAVLTLAGDLEPDKALQRVELYFGDLPAGPEVPEVEWADADLSDDDPCEELVDDVQLSRSMMAYRIPAYGERSWYAADLLAMLLSGGKSSLLHNDLVYRREIAQSAGAFVFPTEESGCLHVSATARPGTSAEEVENALLEHIDRIAENGPRQQDVERARNRVLTSYYGEIQTLERRADLLSQMTTYFDDPLHFQREIELLHDISTDDVRQVAQRLSTGTGRARVRVEPQEGAR